MNGYTRHLVYDDSPLFLCVLTVVLRKDGLRRPKIGKLFFLRQTYGSIYTFPIIFLVETCPLSTSMQLRRSGRDRTCDPDEYCAITLVLLDILLTLNRATTRRVEVGCDFSFHNLDLAHYWSIMILVSTLVKKKRWQGMKDKEVKWDSDTLICRQMWR